MKQYFVIHIKKGTLSDPFFNRYLFIIQYILIYYPSQDIQSAILDPRSPLITESVRK
jgi:hypothetical protein